MSTLADILIRQPLPLTGEAPWVRLLREVPDWLKDTPVIVINETAQYFFDVFWDEHDLLEDRDFPNVAPPFPCFWMEYRVPRWISSGEPPQRVPMEFGGWRFGFYWLAVDRPEASGGWELHSLIFTEDKESGLAIGPMFSVRARTDAKGQLLELAGQSIATGDPDPPKEETESFHNDMMVLHYPAILAVCFMHCANVKLTDHKPKESHERRYQTLYGRAPIVYKTLDITPMRSVIRSEGGDKCGPRQALHIMRGHFKHFEERPLFGKHKGMWWSSQLRGTLGHGYVKKTYEIRAPKGKQETS